MVFSANSLLTIINEILDYSKAEAGKLTLDPIPFNLSETVDDVVNLFDGEAKEKGIKVVL
jgi:signal transduction histidine kinase